MLKPARAFFGIAVLLIFLTALPLSIATGIKGSVYSFLEIPITFSKNTAKAAVDLFYFRRNAQENKELRKSLAQVRFDRFRMEELSRENERFSRLLDIKRNPPANLRRMIASRVISRAASAWNRVFLVDKGTRQGVRVNMLVLSELAVIGKVVEAGPGVSKALLITDPNARIGVLIQRTRQQGVLFGVSGGECRVKYISMDAEVKPGDIIETAGIGGFFPKGLLVGKAERVWKEPGQIYQVAQVKPFADLSRAEEVLLVE